MLSVKPQRACLLVAVVLLVFPDALSAKIFSTVDEALSRSFPGCDVHRMTVFLTDEQMADAGSVAGLEVASGLVHPYVSSCEGRPNGTAYFDTHRVRTLPETLMIVVSPEGTVRQVEILVFDEPEEYIPRPIWYRQFLGETLDDDLLLGRGIDGVTGATLTARATTEAVRRVLALHSILQGRRP